MARDSRVGLGATFDDDGYDVATGVLHMVVGRRGYVGIVRLEDGTLNVGAAVDPELVAERGPAGAVASILTEAGRTAPGGLPVHGWRGTPALTRRPARVGGERLLRAGDAAGYVEPFTGEGMCWAFASGVAVTGLALEAVESWTPDLLDRWSVYQGRSMERARLLCRSVSWGLRRPAVVRGAVAALARVPSLAAPFRRRAARRPPPLAARPPEWPVRPARGRP